MPLEQLIVFAAFGTLPGIRQTVPRAELFAIMEIIINLRAGVQATITTDSKLNVDLFHAGDKKANSSANGDLWANIFNLIREKGLTVNIRWAKGHATTQNIDTHRIAAVDAFGNYIADAMANRAALLHQVFAEDSFAIKWHQELVTRIQKRAVVLLSLFGLRTLTKPRATMQPAQRTRADAPSTLGRAIVSEHSFTTMGRTLFCWKCHQTSPPSMREVHQWLDTPCTPDRLLIATYTAGTIRPTRIPQNRSIRVGKATIHPTHTIFVYKGLYFCRACACYAVKKLEKLATPCDPAGRGPEAAKQKRLAVLALLQGKLPKGVSQWPNASSNYLLLEEDR